MKVNQEVRAYRAWNVLIKYAEENKKITYKELGAKLGVHHRTCRYFLHLIQDYCLKEKLPPLTILVVNRSGELGEGFIAWDVDNLEEGLKKVFNFNWKNLINPFSYASNGKNEEKIVLQLINREIEQEVVYREVKVRGVAQSVLRKALLEVYNSKCAFCNIRIPELLEAAHIVPWSKCEDSEKVSINNGILLCRNHHTMFDKGIVSINQDYRISVASRYKSKLNERRINLPKDKNHYPSKALLNKKAELMYAYDK